MVIPMLWRIFGYVVCMLRVTSNKTKITITSLVTYPPTRAARATASNEVCRFASSMSSLTNVVLYVHPHRHAAVVSVVPF